VQIAGQSQGRRVLLGIVATTVLVFASDLRAEDVAAKPHRIVSVNLCADELVLRLADRENQRSGAARWSLVRWSKRCPIARWWLSSICYAHTGASHVNSAIAPNVPMLHATLQSAACSARNSARSVTTSRLDCAASGLATARWQRIMRPVAGYLRGSRPQ
jgi:hypothetical protein